MCRLTFSHLLSSVFCFFFFFSSRRRHTRCSRDWSSDVCSSDLLVFGVAGANHLDLAARRPFGEPAGECDGALDRQFRLIGNAARLLYLAVQEEWPILGDRYRDSRVAEIGTLEPAGNALFQLGDREALHHQLTEKGIVEPAGVVDPNIHAEIFFTKNLDDDPV